MHVPSRVIRPRTRLSPRPDGARWLASSPIPTRFGTFVAHVFTEGECMDRCGPQHGPQHVAMVYGEVQGGAEVPVRVHSECLTSEVFGSLKCDCKQQLDAALEEIARRGVGAVLYLRQEGRGIGLANKIRAYRLQADGADTVDANRLLGLPDDARTYEAAADMLAHLGVASVLLMTNNPAKVDGLRALGVRVDGRLPVVVEPSPHAAGYLETKRVRMAHELPDLAQQALGRTGSE